MFSAHRSIKTPNSSSARNLTHRAARATVTAMLDDFDFDPLAVEGTRWTRRITGVFGVICGAGLGWLYTGIAESTGILSAGYIGAGAAIGGFLGWLFSFWIFVGLILFVILGVVIGWQAFFGQ